MESKISLVGRHTVILRSTKKKSCQLKYDTLLNVRHFPSSDVRKYAKNVSLGVGTAYTIPSWGRGHDVDTAFAPRRGATVAEIVRIAR